MHDLFDNPEIAAASRTRGGGGRVVSVDVRVPAPVQDPLTPRAPVPGRSHVYGPVVTVAPQFALPGWLAGGASGSPRCRPHATPAVLPGVASSRQEVFHVRRAITG